MNDHGIKFACPSSLCKGSTTFLIISRGTPACWITDKNLDSLTTNLLRDFRSSDHFRVCGHVTTDTHKISVPLDSLYLFLRLWTICLHFLLVPREMARY